MRRGGRRATCERGFRARRHSFVTAALYYYYYYYYYYYKYYYCASTTPDGHAKVRTSTLHFREAAPAGPRAHEAVLGRPRHHLSAHTSPQPTSQQRSRRSEAVV